MGLIEEAYSNMGTSKDDAIPDTLLFLTCKCYFSEIINIGRPETILIALLHKYTII